MPPAEQDGRGARSFDRRDVGTGEQAWLALPQWRTVPPLALDGPDALVVAVAHPDDESLACGGLLARAGTTGLATTVVVATDGEGSHPDSPTHDADRLAARRRTEVAAAVAALHPGARLVRLGLPDGGLEQHGPALADALEDLLAPGTLLVTTWRHDGHADHEALGRAGAEAAARRGARHLEAPIWLWLWGGADDLPWHRCAVLRLDAAEVERKDRAQREHVSQLEPLSPAPGDEAVVHAGLLASFRRPFETYLEHEPAVPDAVTVFEELHRGERDPWDTATSWYEERKRALTLAALPRRRAGALLEVGCSVGELTAALASRADAVHAVDVSAAALAVAVRRCEGLPVTFARARVPQEWPAGRYDVVVLSEVGYFLSGEDLAAVLRLAATALTPDGALLLVHWRHEVDGWPLDGPTVHAVAREVAAQHGLGVATQVEDDDLQLDLYRPRGRRSLAAEEGKVPPGPLD